MYTNTYNTHMYTHIQPKHAVCKVFLLMRIYVKRWNDVSVKWCWLKIANTHAYTEKESKREAAWISNQRKQKKGIEFVAEQKAKV